MSSHKRNIALHVANVIYSMSPMNALNRKARTTTADVISIDNHLCTSKPKIADEFNNYFATICANNKIPDIPTSYTHYLNNTTESTFNFKLIDNATTMQYLSKITNSHSCGHDNISSSTLKCIAHEICECLSNTYHKSINYNRNFSRKFKNCKSGPNI